MHKPKWKLLVAVRMGASLIALARQLSLQALLLQSRRHRRGDHGIGNRGGRRRAGRKSCPHRTPSPERRLPQRCCVPSKALIRSSRVIADLRESARFGVNSSDGTELRWTSGPSWNVCADCVRKCHIDSAKRFQNLGVDVFFGDAHFLDSETVKVANPRLPFKKAVIATGAHSKR